MSSTEQAAVKASEVSNLEFIRVSDSLSHKWAIWEVNFTLEGKPFTGFLGGCPFHPSLMHEETIEDCEVNF